MNTPLWTDIIMAGTSILSVFLTTGGLIAVYIQIKKLRESVWSDNQSRLCDQSLNLIKFLADRPETYDYFYRKKELKETDPHYEYVMYASEALANFLEHLVLQKNNLPEAQWVVWQRFIRSTFEGSSALQVFFYRHRSWYSPELLKIFDDCNRTINR